MAYKSSNPNDGQIERASALSGVESASRDLSLVDLRSLNAPDFEPLLREQTVEWGRELDWDYSKSADLMRRFLGARQLHGAALLDRGEIVGCGYTGLEDRSGLIGDIYVRPSWRGGTAEALLLRVLFDALIENRSVHRIESQLMLVEASSAGALQRELSVRLFERTLMTLDSTASMPPGTPPAAGLRFEPWASRHHEAAAAVIAFAYNGHIDSEINERYRTAAGAHRFLHELVHFPGSAAFCSAASYIAFDANTGSAAGISLSSFVADEVGHIAELCVAPHARGAGLGYELLRKSVEALRNAGAKRVSLTVTAANASAVRLYTRCGFRERRRFYAYLWERSR